jgi:hypothetical protein
MNTVMKRSILSVLAVLMLTAGVSAQEGYDSVIAKKNYNHKKNLQIFDQSLKSSVPGIVEGTMYVVVLYKKYFPELDYSDILDDLHEITKSNADLSLNFKAQLAAMYLNNSSAITITPVQNASEHDYLFREIAHQLETKLLAYKN